MCTPCSCVRAKPPQSCLTLCDPMDCSPPGSSVHGDSPGKNPGVGCHALLQGVFPTQGWNPGLPHRRQILYRLSYKGSPPLLLLFMMFSCFFLSFKKKGFSLTSGSLVVNNLPGSQEFLSDNHSFLCDIFIIHTYYNIWLINMTIFSIRL